MDSFASLVLEAHARLFPQEDLGRNVRVRFSGKFKPYNASVRWSQSELEFRLSRSWESVNKEILIGLFQELLLKVKRVKDKPSTSNLSLYHHFLQNLHLAAERQDDVDPALLESFERVNTRYFDGTLDRPRLLFGQRSKRTLGHYHYASDTVTLSALLKDDAELLDYVMYHELLHKFLKYEHKTQKTRYHTARFRELEGKFPNGKKLESRLKTLGRRKMKKGFFSRLF